MGKGLNASNLISGYALRLKWADHIPCRTFEEIWSSELSPKPRDIRVLDITYFKLHLATNRPQISRSSVCWNSDHTEDQGPFLRASRAAWHRRVSKYSTDSVRNISVEFSPSYRGFAHTVPAPKEAETEICAFVQGSLGQKAPSCARRTHFFLVFLRDGPRVFYHLSTMHQYLSIKFSGLTLGCRDNPLGRCCGDWLSAVSSAGKAETGRYHRKRRPQPLNLGTLWLWQLSHISWTWQIQASAAEKHQSNSFIYLRAALPSPTNL